jgi:hypothetical protein
MKTRMRTSRRPQRSRPHNLLTSTCFIVLVWSDISGAGLLLLSPHEACNLQQPYAVRRAKQLIGGESHGLPHVRGGRPDKTDECDVIRGGHHIGPAPRDDRDPEVYTTDILILPRTRAQPASPYPSSATATNAVYSRVVCRS